MIWHSLIPHVWENWCLRACRTDACIHLLGALLKKNSFIYFFFLITFIALTRKVNILVTGTLFFFFYREIRGPSSALRSVFSNAFWFLRTGAGGFWGHRKWCHVIASGLLLGTSDQSTSRLCLLDMPAGRSGLGRAAGGGGCDSPPAACDGNRVASKPL